MCLQENTNKVLAQVTRALDDAERSRDSVTVLAVTKYVDVSTAAKLVDTGINHLAENRVDKFLDKYNNLKDRSVTWHLIGTLQRRKVKEVINYVDYFHALDSLKLAQEIQKRAIKPIKCFLQVNISGEESKHGFSREELAEALPILAQLDNIEIVGLMTMAPFDATETELNDIFHKTNQLRESLEKKAYPNMPMTELSMGMSGDFPIAIAHGATFVRIGSAFFN